MTTANTDHERRYQEERERKRRDGTDALDIVLDALREVDVPVRRRVLRSAIAFFDLPFDLAATPEPPGGSL